MSDQSLPALELGPVHLSVLNLARSLVFYQDTLGFKILDRRDDRASLGADAEPLLQLSAQPEAAPRRPRTAGLYHYAVLLPDRPALARSLQRLAEKRYPLQGASDHGVSEALYLADPDGHGIEIYADQPRDAWPRRGDRLEMVTEPLDVDDLLSTLTPGEHLWEGLPAGTRIGHVHLHVSDLGKAEEFYHRLLGLDVVQRYGPSALFMSAGGYHHHVGVNTWAGTNVPPPLPEAIGLRYFTLVLPDRATLQQTIERLRQAGVEYQEQDGGVLARDPAGIYVLLRANGQPAGQG